MEMGVCGDYLHNVPRSPLHLPEEHLCTVYLGGGEKKLCVCMYTHTQIFVPTQFCIQSLISFRIVMPPAQMPQSSLVQVQIPNPSTLFSPKALIS